MVGRVSPAIESYLVLSDVHLGSDLNDRGTSPRRSDTIDRDLARFLDHYAGVRPPAGRWRLVVAGDFIDFIGMSVEPGEGAPPDTALDAEEIENGLGGAEDHSQRKLQRVAERHADVFAALAGFVAAGNAVTMLSGNHDIDFHWGAVKADFRLLLLDHARRSPGAIDEDAFLSRIDFEPWFFYRSGVVYIEHGHQYDPYCATDHVMTPVVPSDRRRTVRDFSSILLRHVVRRTPGMKEYGHDTMGLADYIGFAARLGLRGLVGLAARFARAVAALFRVKREHDSEAARAMRDEHDVKVVSRASGVASEVARLRALVGMQVAPITRTVRGIMASVLLDRLSLAFVSVLLVLVLLPMALWDARFGLGAFAVPVVAFAGMTYLSRQRKLDPAEEMATRAEALAALFPAPFVVMGHTHVPANVALPTTRYINLGSWAEEAPDGPEHSYRAARTHLVIDVHEGTPRAELRAWSAGDGDQGAPVPFR
jgi:UDP-2,3-diacylglucosamine pyrophosphatase LpxH